MFIAILSYAILSFCNLRLSDSRADLLEPISFGSEVRLLALEQELQELREQISTIVKNNKLSKCTYEYIYFVILKE